MQHAGTREPTISKRAKTIPGDAMAIAPSPERMIPVPDDLRPETGNAVQIAGDSMVVHVALHHAAEPVSQRAAAVMHMTAQMLFDSLEFGPQPLGNSLPSHSEAISLASPPTDVGEPQEVEGLRLALPTPLPMEGGTAAELDQACFIRVEGETEACETLLKVLQEAFSVTAMLEPKNEIVSIAHDDHIASSMTTSPLLCPQVQDIVEIHIGKQRRDHRSLWRTHRGLGPGAILGHSGPEPLTDQAEYPGVSDSVLEESQQPFMVDGVEKAPDVCVEHPVHFLAGQTYTEPIQPVVRAAAGSEPVGKSEEVRFVDGVENRHQGVLDDLVLKSGNAQRSLAPIRLGDVGPLGGLCTVTPAMNSLMQVVQPLLQPFLVPTPCDPVDPGGRLPLKGVEAIPELFDVHVME